MAVIEKNSFTVFCNLFICQTLKTVSCYYISIAQLKEKLFYFAISYFEKLRALFCLRFVGLCWHIS